MIDLYSLKARLYPVIILFFPLIIVAISYSVEFQEPVHVISSMGLVGSLTYLFSQLGRDRGKIKEPSLWLNWGGCPSIQVMRINDGRIDVHTKKRYHQKLQLLCPVPIAPHAQMETNSPLDADEIYMAWTKYLISQTRDVKRFNLLFKDNVSYGFRRNLWALKPYAITLCILLLIATYGVWYFKLKTFNPLLYPDSFIFSTIGLLLVISFWIIIVKPNWVKIPAFSYADRLCETTETLTPVT